MLIYSSKIYLKNGVVTTEEQGQTKQPNLLERIMGVKPTGATEEAPMTSQQEQIKKQFEISKVKTQVQTSGLPQDYDGKRYFINPDTGTVNSFNIATKEKELTSARYELVASQLKKAEDYKTWSEITQKYVDYLKQYKNNLTDEAEKLRLQKTIETQQTELDKYKEYNGFTKPKAAKKPKRITIKKVTFPKVKLTKVKVKKVTIPKPKKIKQYKLKTKKVKSTKVKLSAKLT